MSLPRLTTLVLAVAAGFALVAADAADARVGGGRSIGSRGAKTYTAPPATNTAPNAAPIDRSMTQKSAPTSVQAAKPGASTAAQPSRFGGWRGLLMGGLFAAALASIFGVGALASVLGFLLQFALIAGILYLAVAFIRARNQPALARASTPAPRPQGDLLSRPALGSTGGPVAPAAAPIIVQDDLDDFERLLGDIQRAFSGGDTEKLAALTTPEMLSYLSQELADNAKRGLRNEIFSVKLLQGDVSEAWRENGSDYATVAMRFSLIDATIDQASGRVVSGDRARPSEATELWTFRRDDRARGDGWQLSAVQQAA
jgi:predicted lipid-binding transport protein (Tim44 family)